MPEFVDMLLLLLRYEGVWIDDGMGAEVLPWTYHVGWDGGCRLMVDIHFLCFGCTAPCGSEEPSSMQVS